MSPDREPDLKRALRPVPTYERAVREVSRMLREAGIRHALVGALGANAYRNRPRTTEDIKEREVVSGVISPCTPFVLNLSKVSLSIPGPTAKGVTL